MVPSAFRPSVPLHPQGYGPRRPRAFLDLPSGAKTLLISDALPLPMDWSIHHRRPWYLTFETMLREEFKYSLDIPELPEDSLYKFLIRERQGHCEFFAAGLTLLLRMNGIPARVVGGFAGGTWDASTSTLSLVDGMRTHGSNGGRRTLVGSSRMGPRPAHKVLNCSAVSSCFESACSDFGMITSLISVGRSRLRLSRGGK